MNTMYNGEDRVRQVNWIRQEAGDIVDTDMSDGQTTAEELVAFWEQGAEKPAWFDASDRNLLVRFVSEQM